MRVPFTSGIVAPLWIIGVGIVAALAPPPGVVTGVFLLLACVVVVPVIITSVLCKQRGRLSRPAVSLVVPACLIPLPQWCERRSPTNETAPSRSNG